MAGVGDGDMDFIHLKAHILRDMVCVSAKTIQMSKINQIIGICKDFSEIWFVSLLMPDILFGFSWEQIISPQNLGF